MTQKKKAAPEPDKNLGVANIFKLLHNIDPQKMDAKYLPVVDKKAATEFEEEVKKNYHYGMLVGAINHSTSFSDFIDTLLGAVMHNKQQVMLGSMSGNVKGMQAAASLSQLQEEEAILMRMRNKEKRLN